MFGALANGTSRISGFLNGEDCLCTMAALQQMGVHIEIDDAGVVIIRGAGLSGLQAPVGDLDMGNSGTAMRLFLGLLAAQRFDSRLTGDRSLSTRPMGRVIRPLAEMGANIVSADGRPPLEIKGSSSLVPISYASPVASAQVKSAILLAGLYARGTTHVVEPATTRDHTERMLVSMGVRVGVADLDVSIEGGQSLTAADIEVPADISSAAFLMVATLLAEDAELSIPGVGINPTRTGILNILQEMGADISLSAHRDLGAEPVADMTVRSSELRGIDVDPALVSLAIDEFPLLFIAAAAATGSTRFSGIGELRVKESDRIASMAQGLAALGIEVEESPDGALVHGGTFTGGTVDSYGDHRIAMAFSAAASRAAGPVRILGADAVDTWFPGFIECMQAIGLNIDAQEGA